jgi:RNA polymerase sigma-70 factor (ECF subfamily)
MEKRNTKNNVEIEKFENYLVYETNEQDILLNEKIKEIIETLSDDYKEVIELRYYSDLTYDEIAEALNISESLVKVRLFRAKNLLIKKMEMFKGYINE